MKYVSIFFIFLLVVIIGLWYWLSQTTPTPIVVPVTPTSTVVTTTPPIATTTPEVKIQLDTLDSGDTLTSSSTITGRARGPWYFEASFPVELRDSNGTLLVQKPAQATSDWMTTDWVPFTVTLSFPAPVTATGTLIFRKDNPSGEPVNDDQYSIEVQF